MTMIPVRRSVPIKGMNTVSQPRSMSEDFAPVIENLWYNDGLSLRKRLRHSIANTTVAPDGGIKDMFEYSYNGVTTMFVQSIAGNIYSADNTLNTYTATGVVIVGNINVAQLKDILIISDETGIARTYNGT